MADFFGTSGADTLIGTSGDDSFYANDLDGVVDFFLGGAGDDVYTISAGDIVVELGAAGYDRVILHDYSSSIYLVPANVEYVSVDSSSLVISIFGTEGDNEILHDGPLILHGGAGDDVLRGNSTLHGDEGNDTLVGQSAEANLFGDGGDDVLLWGGPGQVCEGGAGIDTLVVQPVGALDLRTIAGEPITGIERIDFDSAISPITLDEQALIALVGSEGTLSITGDAGSVTAIGVWHYNGTVSVDDIWYESFTTATQGAATLLVEEGLSLQIPPEPVADSVALSGDSLIEGLLQGSSWIFRGPQVLTYSFNSTPDGLLWTTEYQDAATRAIQAWDSVANIDFLANFSDTTGPINESRADIAFGLLKSIPGGLEGLAGMAGFPSTLDVNGHPYLDDINSAMPVSAVDFTRVNYPQPEGDVFLDALGTYSSYLDNGGAGYATIVHEMGHALGLKHPHDDGGNARPLLPVDYDAERYTSMSYVGQTGVSVASGSASTPMPLDILAIQYIYGANLTYHTGDDSYYYDGALELRTIWDAGGDHDEIRAAAVFPSGGVSIDLRPGSFTTPLDVPIDETLSLLAIAYGVTIENAVGSNSGDLIIGNDAGNVIDGAGGDDTLDGGPGTDTLLGGFGDDDYFVEGMDDTLIEFADQGLDTVWSYGDFTLPDNLDSLVLTGTDAIEGAGNPLANTITGNAGANLLAGGDGNDTLEDDDGNDTLDGGLGTDTVAGGDGNDTYVVDAAGDVVSENPGEGSADLVLSSVNYALGANFENLMLTGTALTGTGNSLNNVLTGNNQDNTLIGGFGSDSLMGGHGGDLYVVSSTVIAGVPGIVFVADTVTENSSEGIDTVYSSSSYALPANVENLVLTGAPFWRAYTGNGNALGNTITGSDGGRDRLYGLAGDDLLEGLGGNDFLYGGDGNDTIRGNADADTLDGGSGADILQGGGGGDVLMWDVADTSAQGGNGVDSLLIDGGGRSLNLAGLAGSVIQDVESVNLTGSGNNTLTLALADVLAISSTSDTLRVAGNAGDVVNAGSGWAVGSDQVIGANTYHTYTQSSATLLIDTDITQNVLA